MTNATIWPHHGSFVRLSSIYFSLARLNHDARLTEPYRGVAPGPLCGCARLHTLCYPPTFAAVGGLTSVDGGVNSALMLNLINSPGGPGIVSVVEFTISI